MAHTTYYATEPEIKITIVNTVESNRPVLRREKDLFTNDWFGVAERLTYKCFTRYCFYREVRRKSFLPDHVGEAKIFKTGLHPGHTQKRAPA